jgi:drug/metabolite transporter (DMT)-like permease
LIFIFIILKLRKEDVDFKNGRDYRLLLVRSAISAINGAVAGLFQMYLPLTVYYTINSSTTIFSFVLNYLLYHVPVSARQVKAIIAALIGIVLVINGRAIYQIMDSSYEFTSNFDYTSSELWVQILMGILVVVWSCIWAYGIVITGKHHATFH